MNKLIKWLSHKMGYKIVMIKIGGEVPSLTIEGDKELLKYVDVTGYTFKKEPIKRTYPKFIEPEPIKPLTSEQLKELGITVNVDNKEKEKNLLKRDSVLNKNINFKFVIL